MGKKKRKLIEYCYNNDIVLPLKVEPFYKNISKKDLKKYINLNK